MPVLRGNDAKCDWREFDGRDRMTDSATLPLLVTRSRMTAEGREFQFADYETGPLAAVAVTAIVVCHSIYVRDRFEGRAGSRHGEVSMSGCGGLCHWRVALEGRELV